MMVAMTNRILLFMSLFVIVTTLGCNSGPKLHPVTGTVTYNGQTVAGADVTLHAANEAAELKPARGVTDASGNFSVKTYLGPDADRNGAMAGQYKITVTKFPQTVGIADPYKPGGIVKNELPEKYATAPKTPLSREVTTGTNHFPLELVD